MLVDNRVDEINDPLLSQCLGQLMGARIEWVVEHLEQILSSMTDPQKLLDDYLRLHPQIPAGDFHRVELKRIVVFEIFGHDSVSTISPAR